MSTKDNKDEYLAKALALVKNLESGNTGEAETILDEIMNLRESSLFQEIGKLTRQLHETINGFQVDSRLHVLTRNEIPDAKERLNYVIVMTEQSANRTLNAVEKAIPLSEELKNRSDELNSKWERFRQRQMPVEEFRALSKEIDEFMSWTSGNAGQMHENLSEILMAQDFQDLTGQIIRKVISLVQEMESSLVELIRITGSRLKTDPSESENEIACDGPRIPGCESHKDRVNGQDQVDDLLSSLGF
ncbi:MAG: protein phosphatase CheZ [Gammaproteobacteria bacterium]|nr:protein phosphatase CheZ [Gammaproteobacteria bacterium]